MTLALEKLADDESIVVYASRSLIALVWKTTPVAASLDTVTRTLFARMRARREPFVLCAISPEGIGLPDAATRSALHTAVQRIDPYLACATTVVRSSGFQAAAIRALLSGLSQTLRPRYPVAFVANEREAAVMLAKHWPAADAPMPTVAELSGTLLALDAR